MPDSRPRGHDGAEDARTDGFGSTGDTAELEALRDRLATLEAENEMLASRLSAPRPLLDALRESEQRFRTILASEPACVKLVAEDGALLSMNPAGLEMIEAGSEDEVMGLCVFDLVLPDDRGAFVDLHERVFRGERVELEFEIEGLKGTRRQMETFAAPLEDDHGRIVAQLAVTHDITQRKREQEELHAYRDRLEALVAERTAELERSRAESRRNERLASLGTLAAGIGHELNNPLGTILLGAEMAESAESDAERTAALERIRRDVARCNQIVKSMLQFGRDEDIERIPLSLNQIARGSKDHLREEFAGRSIHCALDLAPDAALVRGDPAALGQVVLNLMQNAALATEAGGRIEVRTVALADGVRCEVLDQGHGMTEEVRARAADPFFTTRVQTGGTGLGLSVSHGIVTAHGGTLEIASAPGEGTCVTFTLPGIPAPR